MNFLPQTTIQPVSGSQAAKAAAEPTARRDLPDLSQPPDAPRPVARHRLHRTQVPRRETHDWSHDRGVLELDLQSDSEGKTTTAMVLLSL